MQKHFHTLILDLQMCMIISSITPYKAVLPAPYVRKCSFMKTEAERKTLRVQIHEGKSVILTVSAVKFKRPAKAKEG